MKADATERVAIVGLGLMGGSLGLALRAGKTRVCVAAYARRPETLRQALKLGAIDEAAASPAEAVRGADVVVVCTPVLTIPAMVRDCRTGLKAGAVVTDVGSTKAEVAREAAAALAGTQAVFVGSHPMAGSEKTGLDAARADLYRGAVVAVTPAAGTAPAAVARVSALWTGVGARVLPLDPAVHDERVARTSHLVHLAATVLADTVGREAGEDVAAFCGPGFRDTTRVASSSAEVWDDIVRTNADAILSETRAFRARLDGLIAALEKRDFEAVRRLLESGRARRECLLREAPGAAGGAR